MKLKSKTYFSFSFILLISIFCIPLLFQVQEVNSNSDVKSAIQTTDDIVQMNLWILGSTSGSIEGGVTTAGREGSMEVIGYHHKITAPLEGTYQHYPFRIVKPVDKASPLLMKALCNREILSSVELRFYQKSTSGVFFEYYEIKLTDARLLGIESHALPSGGFSETLSFEYDTITWTWTDGGIEYTETVDSRV